MSISCVALDVNSKDLKHLSVFIRKIPFLNLIKAFDNTEACSNFLNKETVNLLFLNVELNEFTGFQFIDKLIVKPLVVITSSSEKYALQGYEFDVTDYLIKPISWERFYKTATKIQRKIEIIDSINKPIRSNFCFVKTEHRLQKINFQDILYIEGMGDYLKIITVKEKILTLQSFRNIEKILPNNEFCRVHKSFLVSLDKIHCIEKNNVRISDKLIPISDTYRKQFYYLLGNITID